MNNLGEKIKYLRKSRGLTQGELADRCGWLSQSRIGNYERGIREPSFDDLKKIADVLSCPVTELISEGDSNVAQTGYAPGRYVYPVLDAKVSAGAWNEAIELPPTGETMEAKEYAGAEGFWLRVSGDSMKSTSSPSFFDGMYILVKPNPEPAAGKYVVALLENSGEATFKQFIVDAGIRYLKPLNPSYPMIQINGNCRFIGEVVDVSMKGFL